MKVLFMGTPDFAVPVLEGLIESPKHQVVAIVTQPDKARGRSGKLAFSPVKEVAIRAGIPVLQPAKIREKESVDKIRSYSFDVAVVAAFGQILSKEILELPKYGCINVHGSLLPRWRGAAPIQWSILAGDRVTGITTMQMNEGLDTGDMLLKKEVVIGENETGGELFDRMAGMGSQILLDTLDAIENRTILPEKQDDSKSTYAKMLTKDMGILDFSKKAVELERVIRGLNPWPSAYTRWGNKTLKIWSAMICEENSGMQAGQIASVDKKTFMIQTGQGCLIPLEVQLEGKKRMKTEDFLRGIVLESGQRLG